MNVCHAIHVIVSGSTARQLPARFDVASLGFKAGQTIAFDGVSGGYTARIRAARKVTTVR